MNSERITDTFGFRTGRHLSLPDRSYRDCFPVGTRRVHRSSNRASGPDISRSSGFPQSLQVGTMWSNYVCVAIFQPSFETFFSNSVIRYTSRVNYDVACQMDFHTYPSDVQSCQIKLESFGHTQDQMQVPISCMH